MKKNLIQKGKEGELLAIDFLEKANYKILETNFRIRQGEIDIISEKKKIIHFIEVKYRDKLFESHPLEIFTKKKQKKMKQVAEIYLQNHEIYCEIDVSFDLIFILRNKFNFYKNLF